MDPNERAVDGVSMVLFVAASLAIALLLPSEREVSPGLTLAVLAGYALVLRARFEFGTVSASPEQLVLVPMLLLLPLPLVPVIVALAGVLSSIPDSLRGERHRWRVLTPVSDSWFVIGPVLVLAALAPGAPSAELASAYLLAFGTQLGVDCAWAVLRERLLGGPPLRTIISQFVATARVDALLTPIAFAVSVAAVGRPLILLTVAPLVWLLWLFSHERRERHTAALERDRAQGYLDVAGSMILVLERGEIRLINRKGCSLLGYQEEELVGESWLERVVSPQDRSVWGDRLAGVEAGGASDAAGGEHAVLTKDGQERILAWNAHTIFEHGRAAGVLLSGEDITERRLAERQVAWLAYHDPLTSLANRALLHERLPQELTRTRRNGQAAALLFLDVDDFKQVNDALGHDAGDELLREVAGRLIGAARGSDLCVRHGGDEFLMLITDLGRPDGDPDGRDSAEREARVVAERLEALLERPFELQGHEVRSAASIGIALFPHDAAEGDTLLRCADLAMYRAKGAKDARGSRVAFYEANEEPLALSHPSTKRRAIATGGGSRRPPSP